MEVPLLRPAVEWAAALLDKGAKAGLPMPKDPRITLWYEQPPGLRGCIETSWEELQGLTAEASVPTSSVGHEGQR